jgi:ABC-type transport system involved in cytochrome c biogenesis ATPase subunit
MSAAGLVVGVTLFGPEPIGRAHVPITPGVLAMYGRNGAGKTRLLRACGDALRGVARPGQVGFVHIEAHEEPPGTSTWRDYLDKQAQTHFLEARGSTMAELIARKDYEFLHSSQDEVFERFQAFTNEIATEEYSPSLLHELVDPHFRLMALRLDVSSAFPVVQDWYSEDGGAEVIDEVAEGGRFALQATGTPDRPQWTVYSAGLRTCVRFGALLAGDAPATREGSRLRRAVLDHTMRPEEAFEHAMAFRPQLSGMPWHEVGAFKGLFINAYSDLEDPDDASWPGWVGLPVCEVAVVDHLPITVVDDLEVDVDTITRHRLLTATDGQVVAAVDGEEVVFTETFLAEAKALPVSVNEVLASVLEDAPTLSFSAGSPNRWFAGIPPRWTAKDSAAGSPVLLQELSDAQQRWATLAVALTIQGRSDEESPVIFLCDEPESGLHKRAEKSLPRGLSKVATDARASVIAATHSSAMLNAYEVEKLHVTRGSDGHAVAKPMPASVIQAFQNGDGLKDLGLTPADLLQLIRVFVIVEGTHDKIVLDHLLADDLEQASAVVIPTGGANSLPSVVQASLIWEFTDAEVIVVLDNISRETVEPIWLAAQAAMQARDWKKAQSCLYALEKLPGGEPRWLREFLSRAIGDGHWSRLRVAPLEEPDIICYLPPDAFIEGQTWDQLKTSWRQSYPPGRAVNLKKWLDGERKRRGLDGGRERHLGSGDITKALPNAVPTREIQDLGLAIQLASSRRWLPGQ